MGIMMWPGVKSNNAISLPTFLVLVVSCFHLSNGSSTVTSYLSTADRGKLKQVFTPAWALRDLSAVHYSVFGYKLLKEAIPNQQEVCKFLLNSLSGTPTPEVSYYATTAWKSIGSCSGTLPTANVAKVLNGVLEKDTSSVSDIYYAVLTLKSLGQNIGQSSKLIKNLQTALKKDDSISNIGYCLHIASQMGAEGSFAFDRIEDAIVQADEVDGNFLQFEGGLSITALLISGAYNLAAVVNKAPPITDEQAVKFSNYFLSRRSVQTAKGAYSLLNVVNILSNNKFQIPVVLSMLGGGAVSGEKPDLAVKVTDLLGQPLPSSMSLSVESATRQTDSVVIISKKKFQLSADKTVFTVNLLDSKPDPGVYKVTVSALPAAPDTRLVGNVGVPLSVKLMATVVPESVQIGTGDSDQATQPKFSSVTHPGKLSQILEIDTLQKLVLKFSLKDKLSGKPVVVHQAFLRFEHDKTKQEVIFVCDRDSTNSYRLDLDLEAKAGDFGQLSGLYKMELIVGDVILSNSFAWYLGDAKLKLAMDPTDQQQSTIHPMYRPRPEIKHLFREPEKRPPVFVSNLFTGLVLLPLLVLLGLWIKIGVNISNFPCSLSALGFHAGLGAIFSLFACFWLKLNMFQTLKYLIGLGIVTFLSGNKLLAKIASNRKG